MYILTQNPNEMVIFELPFCPLWALVSVLFSQSCPSLRYIVLTLLLCTAVRFSRQDDFAEPLLLLVPEIDLSLSNLLDSNKMRTPRRLCLDC